MRLVVKLSAVLGALCAGLIILALAWTARRESSTLEERQAGTIGTSLERLAHHCASGRGADFERRCLEGMRLALELTEPDALVYAVVLDERPAVLLHTDFLHGDRSQAGAQASGQLAAAAQASGPLAQRFSRVGGLQARLVSVPIRVESRRLGTLAAVYDEAGLARSRERWGVGGGGTIVEAALVAAGLGILCSIGLGLHLLGPLRGLFEASSRVARGDLATELPEDRPDELGRLSAEFNRMTRRLRELDELKADFSSKVTHDLRNPLAAIMAHADVLLGGYNGPLSDDQKQGVSVMRQSAADLTGMVTSLLDLAKLEAGQMMLESRPLDVQAEVRTVVDLIGPRGREFKVTLENRVPDTVRKVYAEPAAFRRVLTNLASNAIKFTPEGGRVTLSARRDGENAVTFCVADTGIGIPKDRIAALFEKFSQVPETRNKVRPSAGTGLGLAICKELVEAQGGRIWAESELLKGARFYFTLPERATA